jgi:hypothetical protein
VRAARAFRLASEAAVMRREGALALDWMERALAELEQVPGPLPVRARHLVSGGRARLAAGLREGAERMFAAARAEVIDTSQGIADPALRERWLAHPDQRGVLGLGAAGFEARGGALGPTGGVVGPPAPLGSRRLARPGAEGVGATGAKRRLAARRGEEVTRAEGVGLVPAVLAPMRS